MHKIRHCTTIVLSIMAFHAEAAQLKTLSSEDGLSNNAIFSIYQNSIGHLYIGTADGLNVWDGHSMRTITAADEYNYFFGNMIWHIYPYGDHILFLHTLHGVARLDTRTNEVQFYEELAQISEIAIDNDGNIITLHRNNSLCLFNTETRALSTISNDFINNGEICLKMTMNSNGQLCAFTDKDIYVVNLARENEENLFISEVFNISVQCRYVSPNYEEEGQKYQLLISEDKIYRFETDRCSIKEISGISNIPKDEISSICPSKDGYYISFLSDGIHFLPDGQENLVRTDIDFGIFSMIPDKNQPIIWIGTDCNGLIKYSMDYKAVTCLTYDMLPHSIKMPVRSVLVDNGRTLWFGTKGNGLFRIPDFGNEFGINYNTCYKYDTGNSMLNHNSVYALREGASGIIWIGTEGRGLNYLHPGSNRIGRVTGSESIHKAHSIIEQNDSILWVGTDKIGVYKCRFYLRNGIPVITDSQLLELCEPFSQTTSVFAMEMENDSTIWIGSRGDGILSYNTNTGKSRVINLPVDYGFAINETFYIAKSDRMLFATGNGLLTYCPAGNSIEVSEFVPKKATHGIVCDKNKNIWVSTNSGIVSLDSLYNYRLSLDRFSDIEVLEYSDGACYFDETSDKIIFGGINGLTIINSEATNPHYSNSYIPDIHITNFIQNNNYTHISSMMEKGRLVLPYAKSMFGIEFSVVDHLNYSNYDFYYNIEGYTSDWLPNEGNIIYMPTLEPGRYKLKITYINKATQYKSEECTLPIYIRPPFYKTWFAYCFYLLTLVLVVFHIVQKYKKRQSSIQEKLKQMYSEKIAAIAQDTTNAINESLSIQITLIIGLCQQIRLASQNNVHIADKVKLVEYNIAKINKTLHMFNEYKSITKTLIKDEEISFIDVNQTITQVIEIIQINTTTKNVKIIYNIEDDLTVALNKEAFLTMLYSLMYKVISTVRGERVINLSINKDSSENLTMTITLSSEKGIYEKMCMMAELTDESYTDDGYDIAFCRRLVSMMSGEMKVSFSEKTATTTIEVVLPSHQTVQTNRTSDNITSINEGINTYNTIIENLLPKNFKTEAARDHIYIISNRKDIYSFLGYFLSDSHNVSSYTDNKTAIEGIGKQTPDAIIYDASSSTNGFTEFIDGIKGNRRMEQAIIITLTSSLQTSERELFVKSGADLCISFPFNMDYLLAALKKLLKKKKETAEYYKSPISQFVLNEGKVIHQADKEFIDKTLQIVERNISNPNLTAQMIAHELGTSTRAMYRRLESITDKKLHQMIRETRMNIAVSLLTSTKLTIDEIMYKVGYENRSTFYRSFKAIYGKTPKEYREDINNNVAANIS